MRHPLAAIEAPIFLGSPGLLIAPSLEVGWRTARQIVAPRDFERHARRLETRRRAVPVIARMAARIESAGPLPPPIRGCRDTRPLGNRADANAGIVDMPAFRTIVDTLAGEGVHALTHSPL